MKETISSVEQYLDRIRTLTRNVGDFIFRGQEDSGWPVECSASRRLRVFLKDDLVPEFLIHYHSAILTNIKTKRFPEYQKQDIHEIDIIADQQHMGAATMLIDFTRNSLVALYFACLSSQIKPIRGAVFVINCNDLKRFNYDENKNYFDPDTHHITGDIGKKDIFFWEPSFINQRIQAQDSVFVFGIPILNIPGENVILVDENAKETILKELDDFFNINSSTLFNDSFGFAKANSVESPMSYRDQYSERAIILSSIKSKEFEKAVVKLDIYIEKYPNDDFGYYQRGIAKFRIGKMNESIEDFNDALKIKPNDYKIHNANGICKSKIGELDSAIMDFDRAIQLHRDSAEVFYNRGNARRKKGDLEGALIDYNNAILLKPNIAGFYVNRSIIKSNLKDVHGAISDLDEAIRLNPNIPEAFYNRGCEYETLSKLGDEEENTKKKLENFKKAQGRGKNREMACKKFIRNL
ncbi:MAG: tetratricopeptide repeat protein [Caldisericia bacterium]